MKASHLLSSAYHEPSTPTPGNPGTLRLASHIAESSSAIDIDIKLTSIFFLLNKCSLKTKLMNVCKTSKNAYLLDSH